MADDNKALNEQKHLPGRGQRLGSTEEDLAAKEQRERAQTSAVTPGGSAPTPAPQSKGNQKKDEDLIAKLIRELFEALKTLFNSNRATSGGSVNVSAATAAQKNSAVTQQIKYAHRACEEADKQCRLNNVYVKEAAHSATKTKPNADEQTKLDKLQESHAQLLERKVDLVVRQEALLHTQERLNEQFDSREAGLVARREALGSEMQSAENPSDREKLQAESASTIRELTAVVRGRGVVNERLNEMRSGIEVQKEEIDKSLDKSRGVLELHDKHVQAPAIQAQRQPVQNNGVSPVPQPATPSSPSSSQSNSASANNSTPSHGG